MRRLMGYTAVILLTGIGLLLLWQFRQVLLLFVLSLFAAAAVRPLMNRLALLGLSRTMAQLLLYIVGIGGFLLLLFLLGGTLLAEVNILVNRAVIRYDLLYRNWLNGVAWQQALAERLPPPLSLSDPNSASVEAMLPAMLDLTQGILGFVAVLLLVLVLSIYWSVDQNRFERLWLSLLPTVRRSYARDSWREIETAVGAYLRSQITQSALAALLLAIGAFAMGLDFPLVLAFFGALAAFVPLFGGAATAVVAFSTGSADGLLMAATAMFYTMLVFGALEWVVEPRLLRRRRNYLLTMLTIIPLVDAFGWIGVVGAPLLAAALEVLIRQYYQAQLMRRNTAVHLKDLEKRYQQLQSQLQRVPDENNVAPSPEISNLLDRLEDLLAQTRKMNLT